MHYEEAESDWGAPPQSTKGGFPIPEQVYIKNVRANCLLNLPNLSVQKEHDKIMVMVCGGPTAKLHLEEIRAKRADDRYVIFCSNLTHDWLISEGIIPHYQFIIDPKPSKIDDVRHPHKDVKYLISVSCDPAVFKALEGYDVTRVFAVSGIGTPKDTDVIRVLFPGETISWLMGGTMAGLRAMSLADIMGFQTVEFYGFDSCYFEQNENGEPIYYSYEKRRKENILECRTDDGRVFMSSPVFASQAQQFLKWKHRLEWINFVIHGDSLTKAINEIDEEKCRPKHDLLITDYHRKINAALHLKIEKEEHENLFECFGQSGQAYAGTVSTVVGMMLKKFGAPMTLLDYGCGKRTLEMFMPPIQGLTVIPYDPCMAGLDARPEPADLVVCTDVLEHVEPECLDNVLDDLRRVTKKIAYIAVSTREAQKAYSDGRNCHLIVEDHDWWRPKIKKRFYILETKILPNDKFICILQAKVIR